MTPSRFPVRKPTKDSTLWIGMALIALAYSVAMFGMGIVLGLAMS